MSNQNTPTPIELVMAIEKLFHLEFEYDMAASEENHKAPFWFSEEVNSLNIAWPTDGWCFLNPPFANLSEWVNKCAEQCDRGVRIVSIWPLSGDLNQIPAWKKSQVNVIHGRVWALVRGVMICVWDRYTYHLPRPVNNLVWNKKEGILHGV